MHDIFTTAINHISEYVAIVFGYMGIIAITIGGFIALYLFFKGMILRKHYLGEIRIKMGQYLALGLEFLLGKDILESIINPTWEGLGMLGSIVVIRTVITFFLERELKEIREEMKDEQKYDKR